MNVSQRREHAITSHENRLSRRTLLRKSATGAAMAGLTVVPRRVLGGAGHTPPGEKVNVAGIGVGNRRWQVIQIMEGHNLVALCDVDSQQERLSSESLNV